MSQKWLVTSSGEKGACFSELVRLTDLGANVELSPLLPPLVWKGKVSTTPDY